MAIVRFDPPSLRKHDRVTAPAAVILESVRYSTLQWSPGGFCIQEYFGSAVPGDRTAVRFLLNFHGFEISFNAMVEVVRVDAKSESLAARYVDLGEREQELLKHFLSGLVSGQIGVVGDTIRHLDIPLHALPAPATAGDRASRLRRFRDLAGRSLLYLIVGPAVIGFGVLTLYRSFFHLEVGTAVVARPIESMVSLGTGRLSRVYVREGQAVAENQMLFTVEDEEANREVQNARLDRDEATAQLAGARSASRTGKQRLNVYQRIAADKQTVAVERVNALRTEVASAQNHLDRVQALVDGGFESQAVLDQAKAEHSRLKGSLREALAELEIAKDAVQAARTGSFYDGYRLVEAGPQFRVDEEAARVRARLAERRFSAAEERASQLTCRAPFAGSVLRIVKSAGSTVSRGEEVAFVEQMFIAPRVQALLTQNEVSQVKVGERVTVQIPALGRSYPATVERVDRANLLANPLLTNPVLRPAWSASAERSAWICITFSGLSPHDQAALRSGMPAVVTMEKQQMAGGWNQIVASMRALARW